MDVSQFTSEHGPTDSDEQFQLENKYLLDVVGITLAYDLTFESIQVVLPGFEGGYASFGTGGSNARTFE